MIKRHEAVAAFGGRPAKLAVFLGISTAGVYRLEQDAELSELHGIAVALAFPDLFAAQLEAYRDAIATRRDAAMHWGEKHPGRKPHPLL